MVAGAKSTRIFLRFLCCVRISFWALSLMGRGLGSGGFAFQPAVIAATEIVSVVERMYKSNPELVEQYPIEVLSEAVYSANRSIGIFKVANEDYILDLAFVSVYVSLLEAASSLPIAGIPGFT